MHHILVVEDEVDTQEIVSGLLEHFDISAEIVGSAEEAWQLLEKSRYEAIVIDLGLPGIDGLSFLRNIRSNEATASLPCMIITAYNSSLVKKEALEIGCDAYLAKPLEHHYFVQEIIRMVNTK
ncbi:MAG: response regulator [Chitinophagaceae bacterium]|nr:response regulator [Chitinophagaceae bacterium]